MQEVSSCLASQAPFVKRGQDFVFKSQIGGREALDDSLVIGVVCELDAAHLLVEVGNLHAVKLRVLEVEVEVLVQLLSNLTI